MDDFFVVIVINTTVPDRDQAYDLYALVKETLEPIPGITISGSVSNHFPEEVHPS